MTGREDEGAAFDRRSFLARTGTAAAALASVMTGGLAAGTEADAATAGESGTESRREQAFRVRVEAARLAFLRPHPEHPANGEEQDHAGFIANYSKALPHNALGEVVPSAYHTLLDALHRGDPAAFEAIPLAGPRKLTNLQAGLAFDLEGPDCDALTIPPAPRIDGAETSAEMAELYWMALLRDVPFTRFDRSPLAVAAANDLSRFSDFRGPKEHGRVTPRTLFRGFTRGDATGPYVCSSCCGTSRSAR